MTRAPATAVGAHVLIPVKDLLSAKSRLAAALTPAHRSELVLAMLADTVAASSTAAEVAAVWVITPDPTVAAEARRHGATVIADPRRARGGPRTAADGLNDALTAAAGRIRVRHPHSILVALQADLPALRAAEFDAALAAAAGAPRSIVTDRHGTGTCALIVAGGQDELAPRFGGRSAEAHAGLGAVLLDGPWPGLRCDVDNVDDLAAARSLGLGPATAAALTRPGGIGDALRMR
ncbi:2-phospho-L-lactate guanylyltransferase [Rhodococcus sp. D2-41]|uniref:2-phospho-L-lactate guanylyltransferase n=1 Tax=Speluncibacter jeojiensis TaxID=2710754 RepID=UPI00240F23CF|nr:2-phospho-L-lactate guanylyltransferase [Rhodococcus sp. D2-41]MDG3011067.1 2-phospho-L-lactate guanylyltransferase [Rhodococcus sp. D2-41]